MTKIKNSKQKLIVSLLVSTLLLFLLYVTFVFEKKIEREMFTLSTSDVFSITQNNAIAIKNILEDSHDYVNDIKNNLTFQQKIENNIKLLITNNIKYAYVLYKDQENKFRFIADASNPSEKAFIGQKFDVDSKIWFDVYKMKKPQLIRHELIQSLSLSYIVPILNGDSVELLLVIDFSLQKVEMINNMVNLMENAIIFILVITVLFLFILVFQMLKYNKVKKSAFVDKLTNVYNRNYLLENQKELNLSEYAIAIVDMDFFKKVNDDYGHDIGDVVLRETAHVISSTIRIENKDIIIRYGGEEFILLLRKPQGRKDVVKNILERVLKNVAEHKFWISPSKNIHITVSIGVNLEPEKSINFDVAFKLADSALYQAKNSGRNNIKFFEH